MLAVPSGFIVILLKLKVKVLQNMRVTGLQDMKYRREGQEVLEVSWRILNSPDWKLEKETPEGDTIYSKKVPLAGKMLKLTVSIVSILDSLISRLGE
jgi:hypothetical protein